MKLSKFLLATLLSSAVVGVQAQTKPVKQKTKIVAKKAIPKKPVAKVKTMPIPINKDPDHYYCPPCGKG
ncbi:hypothetical protein [Pedobacter punctiformis]|uniref:Uncharacterized protein n=1 Tax=Pedobacter punctiformis TaxID=3004097 RepID=A0ABT4L921_9SPHI|nr:hypothetical protein [Pedobacter sp. HCMS5-2]MCZ4244416.1 hypothetical protein [Pedobacter sp. HCMS5-2]